MAALFILLVCVEFCNLAGGEPSHVRHSTLASRIFPVSSTAVNRDGGSTAATIKPSHKVTSFIVNEFSQPHVATRTNGQKSKDSGPSASSGSGSGAIRIVTKTTDFHLQTNYASRQKHSEKDSVQKQKETASKTIKVDPSFYHSSMNYRPKNVETSDVHQNIFSQRIRQTSIPKKPSARSISINSKASRNSQTHSRLPDGDGIKSSSSLPNLFPSPEAHVTRTPRTATMALEPTPSYLLPSHDKLKPSDLSSFPLSVHEGITSSPKESYATITSQSILRLPLSSAPTGSDINNKLPTTRPFTNKLSQTPILPASVQPLFCGGVNGEVCVCFNCPNSEEKCCTEAHSSKRLKQGIVMEIADISVEKFGLLKDVAIRTISPIIARECAMELDCGYTEENGASSMFKRDVNAKVIKSSPQLKTIKHKLPGRAFDQSQKIKIGARPSFNSVTRVLGATAGPSVKKHQPLGRRFDQSQKIETVARPSFNSITRVLGATTGPSVTSKVAVKRYNSKKNASLSAKVFFFRVSTTNQKSQSIEAAMYSTVTSGNNTTQVVKSRRLLNILKKNKARLEKKLNITIKSFKVWKGINKRASVFTSPTNVPSPTLSGTIMYPASCSFNILFFVLIFLFVSVNERGNVTS